MEIGDKLRRVFFHVARLGNRHRQSDPQRLAERIPAERSPRVHAAFKVGEVFALFCVQLRHAEMCFLMMFVSTSVS